MFFDFLIDNPARGGNWAIHPKGHSAGIRQELGDCRLGVAECFGSRAIAPELGNFLNHTCLQGLHSIFQSIIGYGKY